MSTLLFTPFKTSINHIDLPNNFTFPFNYEVHPLAKIAAEELQILLATQKDWHHDFGIDKFVEGSNIGKMFGVLIVKNTNGELGYISAFSGKLAGKNQLPNFVPPIFDLQQEGGFFRVAEIELSKINHQIETLQNEEAYLNQIKTYKQVEIQSAKELKSFRQEMKADKDARKERRLLAETKLTQIELEELKDILKNESLKHQYDYKVLAKNWKIKVEECAKQLAVYEDEIRSLKEYRKTKSAQIQRQLFDQYQFLNIKGETISVADIFKNTPQQVPPAGAGECAAPKLLQYAFMHQLKPVCMCEFWWGQSPKSEIRKHKHFYPSCRSKCEPILGHMLKGIQLDVNPVLLIPKPEFDLEVVYDDDDIIVVNKPEDFLSVPGKTENDCVLTRIKKRYPDLTGPISIHRLDMSTSGLLILAKHKDAHEHIQKQFLNKTIKKRYVALLDGIINTDGGHIKLPLRVDLDNRPHQLVCYTHGKPAITRWEKIQVEGNRTRVYFYPLTGRTHQLRVHAAHPAGLNTPIVGDDLYGTREKRLYLHAEYIRFKHPRTEKTIALQVDPRF